MSDSLNTYIMNENHFISPSLVPLHSLEAYSFLNIALSETMTLSSSSYSSIITTTTYME